MCCGPGHLGAPPEWHKELAGDVIGDGAAVPVAHTIAWWRWWLGPPGPRPGPRSTEGGRGRALPTIPWRRKDHDRSDDWAAELRATDPGGPDLTNPGRAAL
jgi:hypothetical protein